MSPARVPHPGDVILITGDRGTYGFPDDYFPIVRGIFSCSRDNDDWRIPVEEQDNNPYEPDDAPDNLKILIAPGPIFHQHATIYPTEYIFLTKKETTTMPEACPCLNCGIEITDPNFRVVLYNEDFPDVEIGPYCERCYSLLKVCSGCQHAVLASETTHTGNGEHYCRSCMSDFGTCQECGKQKPSNAIIDIDGVQVCTSCINSKYKMCGCCNSYKKKETIVLHTSLNGMRRAGIFRKYGNQVCSECFEKKAPHFKLYEVEECTHCGKPYSYSSSQTSPKEFCPRCWDSFHVCNMCSTKAPNLNSVTYVDEGGERRSKYVCQSCLTRKLTECDACGNYCVSSMKKIVKGSVKTHIVCPTCADKKECLNCSTLFSTREAISGTEGICPDCVKRYVKNSCSRCGRIRDERSRCRVCDTTDVYNYSHKPKIFYNLLKDKECKRGNIFFGFENECTYGSGSGTDDKMYAGLKHLYESYDPSVLVAKSDGSISGHGYEVVTQPMSLMYFHKMDLAPLLNNNLKRSDSCGLHIHVGRDSFISEVHLYKVINFLHNNKKFTTYIAGRGFNGYCCELNTKPSKHLKDSKCGRTERRAMVNLTNKATVEFRLFAGCTLEFELRSRVEALHGLISFQKDSPISQSKSLPAFKDFMAAHAKTYPNASVLVEKFK